MTEQPDNLERTRLRREPQRGSHDPSLIRDIIDTALVCHLGLTDHDGHPLVIPTIHARVDDVLYVHGSAAGRTLRRLATGIDACCTITLPDGIVIALPIDDSSAKVRTDDGTLTPAGTFGEGRGAPATICRGTVPAHTEESRSAGSSFGGPVRTFAEESSIGISAARAADRWCRLRGRSRVG
jgi:hypothetical protein